MGTDVAKAIRKPIAGDVPLAQALDRLVREGELFEKLDGGRVRCYACGHRCVIPDGARGICQVRYNRGGTLYVPHGYVAALQCDPTEKKPFFHILPGSDTLTFGMLGCDFHCGYCFTGDTRIVTSKGVLPFEQLFTLGETIEKRTDAEIAFPAELRAVAQSGQWRTVRAVFKHPYRGKLVTLRPYYLPPLRCTPEHRVYATADPDHGSVEPIEARDLTLSHYLAISKRHPFPDTTPIIDVQALLSTHRATYQVYHQFGPAIVQEILAASQAGVTSRELGTRLGKRPDYIRHVRSKMNRGLWVDERTQGITSDGENVRFYKEKQPGIPCYLRLDESLARLLGFYCAEGSIVRAQDRPNSLHLNFSFGLQEQDLVQQVRTLLTQVLHISASVVVRDTTRSVAVSKASAALLFQKLCGSKAEGKRVPIALLDAPRTVVESFLDAYIAGDGHTYPNGKISVTTTSEDLAYGVAFLALKLGYLPSLYVNALATEKRIEGHAVHQAERQFTVVWYRESAIERRARESDEYFLIPLREIGTEDFDGDVYNMEVEEEHNYLAGLFLVKNCQNWLTSQTLRDPHAGIEPTIVTPEQMALLGKRYGAKLVGSSYNEPLITSEWAVEVFKRAKHYGMRCVYISNGNTTPEVLEYIRPYVDGYKIDLKTMNDKNYRQLGGVLRNVLDSIERVHAMGFWHEVVTLIVPGFNDSNEELMEAARFIRSVSPDIPWHVTAFHQDYHMEDHDNTGPNTLIRAAEIGLEAGLHYVYAGNQPGRVGPYENTFCPKCKALLIERSGYHIRQDHLSGRGTCYRCGEKIAGIWE